MGNKSMSTRKQYARQGMRDNKFFPNEMMAQMNAHRANHPLWDIPENGPRLTGGRRKVPVVTNKVDNDLFEF